MKVSSEISEADALTLEQAVGLCQVSPGFRDQFARNALAAVRAAGRKRQMATLSPSGEHLLRQYHPVTLDELAALVDGLWPRVRRQG